MFTHLSRTWLIAGLVVGVLTLFGAGVVVGSVWRATSARYAEYEAMRVQWPIAVQMIQQQQAALQRGGLLPPATPATAPERDHAATDRP